MVGTFLRLRWALMLAGLRAGNWTQKISAILSIIFGVMAGMGGFGLGLLAHQMVDPWQLPAVRLILGMIFLVWVIGPITIAGSDASMDPVKLVLLPLKQRDLALGLGAATLLGPGGLATILTLTGLTIGLRGSLVGLPLLVLGAALFTLLCVMTSRLVLSVVGMGLRKRGVRDVMAVAVPLAIIVLSQLPNIINQLVVRQNKQTLLEWLQVAATVTRFLPSSFAAETIVAGHEGRLLRGLLEFVVGLLLVAGMTWLWGKLLAHVMTSPPATEGSKGVTQKKSVFALVLARLHPRARAVASKDIKLMLREPAQRVGLIMLGLFALAAVVVPMIFLRQYPLAAFIVCGIGLLVSMTNANMYGYDGSSHWVNVAAGDDARRDLLGKLVARILLMVPPLLVASLASALVIAPQYTMAVVGISLDFSLVGLGLATFQSVLTPYPITYSEDTLMAKNQGSFGAVVSQFVAFPVLGIFVGPFVGLAFGFGDNAWIPSVAGMGAAVAGALGCWLFWWLGVRFSAGRQPELLAAISKRAEA